MIIEPQVDRWDHKLDTNSLLHSGDPGNVVFLTCKVTAPPGLAKRRKNVYLLLDEENATKLLVLLREQLREWRSETSKG